MTPSNSNDYLAPTLTVVPFDKDNPDHKDLRPYSYSILNAMNQCPRWGTIHYGLKKTYTANARAMALEYGSILHEVIASFRLWHLGSKYMKLPQHQAFHAVRLFGKARWDTAIAASNEYDDGFDQITVLGVNILSSGDFYDDDSDSMRTFSNAEECIITAARDYLRNAEDNPIWVEDVNDPTKRVGIEITFDLVVSVTGAEGFGDMLPDHTRRARFIGTIDGVHESVRDGIIPHEFKTAARPSDSWRDSFRTGHQVTGYNVAISTVLNMELMNTRVKGVKSKQTGHVEDFRSFLERRDHEAVYTWAHWFFDAVDQYERFVLDWRRAPMYTHSCNRYFRTCSLMPFCTATPADQNLQLEDMVDTAPSPSEAAVLSR